MGILDFITGDLFNAVFSLLFKGAAMQVILYKLKWLVAIMPLWKLFTYVMNRLLIRADGKMMDYDDMEERLADSPTALATLWSGRLRKRGTQRAGWAIADALVAGFILIA